MNTLCARYIFIGSFVISFFALVSFARAEPLLAIPYTMTLEAGATYSITGTKYVNHDAVLTIPEGTTLLFDKGARLVVYGKLVVSGTASKRVTFARGNEVEVAVAKEVAMGDAMALEERVDVQEEGIATPAVAAMEVAPLLLAASIQSAVSHDDRAGEIVFINGSQPSSVSYADIQDFNIGMVVDTNAVVSVDHVTFKNCGIGVRNEFGSLTLTRTSFVDTQVPGEISTDAVFEHSNSVFSGAGLKGWRYSGRVRGEVHFRSKDGSYYPYSLDVINGGSLYFNYGTTIGVEAGFGILVHEHGELFVNGTELSPVSIQGEGTCSAPAVPFVQLSPQSSLSMRNVNARNLCDGIAARAGAIKITDSTFANGTGTAVIATESSFVTVTGSDFSKNGIGLLVDASTIKSVTNNHFHGNTIGVSVKNMQPRAIVKNNGWGSNSGPTIEDNPLGTGDRIAVENTPEVIYRPWLNMQEQEPGAPSDPDEPDIPDQPEEPEGPAEPVDPGNNNPIIIVPGITGSVLSKDYGDKGELWPNVTKLITNIADSHLDDLALLQSGKPSSVRPVVIGDIIRKIQSADIFAGLIQSLGAAGYVEGANLFVLPYDWRLSNGENQHKLKELVAVALRQTGKSKVDIVAHSMGGLLVKSYLAENGHDSVGHVFNIAVPHLGAPKAFKTLMYGDNMGFTFSLTSALKIPVLNESRVKNITQNMPAVYELLPSKKYIDLLGPYIDDRTQSLIMNSDGVQKVMAAEGRNEKLFSFNAALHDRIDSLQGTTVPTYNFAGCGSSETITGFILTKEQELTLTGFKLVPEHRLRYGAGDGVVPVQSATAMPGAQNFYLAGASHGTMPSLPAIHQAIINIVQGKPVGLTENTGVCASAGTVVEVHSPVSLDIYDEAGNHTGITENGVEYGVEGVQYDVIGNEKTAFLPDGRRFTVVTRAEGIGAYDMYVSKSIDGRITHQAYYHAVPLVSEKSTGVFTVYSEEMDHPIIFIDDDGDEMVDRLISTPAVLDGDAVYDTAAPVTVATNNGDIVTLSATDNGSGVLNTKYSTDTAIWNVYTEPFRAVQGSTVSFVSIDKAGNSEEFKQYVVGSPQYTSGGGNADPSRPLTSPQPVETPQKNTVKTTKIPPGPMAQPGRSTKVSGTFLTAPAPDEGTVMEDPKITKASLAASLGVIAGLGSTTVVLIGAVALLGIGVLIVLSKKQP